MGYFNYFVKFKVWESGRSKKKYFLTHCTTVAMGILCPNIDTLFFHCLEICLSITCFHPFLCNVSEPCSFKIKRWCMWIVNTRNKIRYDDINWLIRSSAQALNSGDYNVMFQKGCQNNNTESVFLVKRWNGVCAFSC